MKYNYHYCKFTAWSTNLAPDVHANSCPHRGSRRGGGGGGGAGVAWVEPALEFLICFSISKRFYLQWKAFDLL